MLITCFQLVAPQNVRSVGADINNRSLIQPRYDPTVWYRGESGT
ncbi:hypothetical protein RHECNPAF_13300155 [Rhizobium etli CNPAF512]|nr:hypothetical protein RHECNPAF_13300155 [Rhizobium etli CNPAF512]